MVDVSYSIDKPDSLSKYVIQSVLNLIGANPVYINKPSIGQSVDVYYGENDNVESSLKINREKSDPFDLDCLNLDIIDAIGQLLTDSIHMNPSPESCDEHGRLKFESSIQSARGVGNLPIVNIYLECFKKQLMESIGLKESDLVPLWPDRKICAIGLSHDVDSPHKNLKWAQDRYDPEYPKLKRIIKHHKRKLKDKTWNDNWLFDDIVNEEKKYDFKSTFYFASRNNRASDSNPLDVGYDIAWPCYKEVFREIDENGSSVGLHASYNSHMGEQYMIEEAKRLRQVSGLDVIGVRHHFWNVGQNPDKTFLSYEKAKILYDSSIAFNDHLGFRRNAALPFQLFSNSLDRELNVIELPTFCMDGNIFYFSDDVEKGVNEIMSYVNIIKDNNGLGIVDWHVRTSYPKNKEFWHWGLAYKELLRQLSKDENIWVTSPDEIHKWLKERNMAISNC